MNKSFNLKIYGTQFIYISNVSKRSKFKYAHMYSILYIYPANLNMHIFHVIQSLNAP